MNFLTTVLNNMLYNTYLQVFCRIRVIGKVLTLGNLINFLLF